MTRIKLDGHDFVLDELPTRCPYCYKSIHAVYYGFNRDERFFELICRCPDNECGRSFIATYGFGWHGDFVFTHTTFGEVEIVPFPEEITNLFAPFVTIYNQAHFAEQHKLSEIAGVGYRKALEYLIKDFLIKQNPSLESQIKRKLLGQCITEHIKDANIKKVAKRAAWLGNDETHYERIWVEKDIEDLKKLIQLTVYWISAELLSDSYEKEMPDKK